MFHMYAGSHWFGMHLLWWTFWFMISAVFVGWYEPVRRKRGRPDGQK